MNLPKSAGRFFGTSFGASFIVATVLWFFAISAFAATPVMAGCQKNQVSLRGDWGQARFSVEVVDTPALRSQGLMHRSSLAQSSGMLFVYGRPQSVSFWMENTLIPLDMVFIDSAGVVKKIHHNAIPLDRNPIFGGNRIIAVLEINGGLARQMGITIGSAVQHPIFGSKSAKWPCF